MWLSFLEDVQDSDWSMTKIVDTLVGVNGSSDKMLLYFENHNQSISGGRSFAEILFGKTLDQSSVMNDSLRKGCSLHKMIRLITYTVGGRAYLNFMGNEFGHPKRVEFLTSDNNYSFSLANRDWDLLATPGVHQDLLSFEKVPHFFNFHPSKSYDRYNVGVEEAGEYQIILNSNEKKYSGQGSIVQDQYVQKTVSRRVDGMRNCLEVLLPSRSAQVYKLTRILRV